MSHLREWLKGAITAQAVRGRGGTPGHQERFAEDDYAADKRGGTDAREHGESLTEVSVVLEKDAGTVERRADAVEPLVRVHAGAAELARAVGSWHMPVSMNYSPQMMQMSVYRHPGAGGSYHGFESHPYNNYGTMPPRSARGGTSYGHRGNDVTWVNVEAEVPPTPLTAVTIKAFNRLNCPTFVGADKPEDTETWFGKLEKRFKLLNINDHQKVVVTAYQLENDRTLSAKEEHALTLARF
ncbi:hypothetical protein RJ639_022770 [Escallonia herrerae]|uniref:Uncharacterized protein n=1 Tax=Escallonia herrerae TaxID=1293975 RepID=A0AA88UZV5_9ASTE|nr:hypothetical protein RJ639_022770 [Escallonia herrerae]